MPMMWNTPPVGKRHMNERFGIFSLLFVREISYYLVTQVSLLAQASEERWVAFLTSLPAHLPPAFVHCEWLAA